MMKRCLYCAAVVVAICGAAFGEAVEKRKTYWRRLTVFPKLVEREKAAAKSVALDLESVKAEVLGHVLALCEGEPRNFRNVKRLTEAGEYIAKAFEDAGYGVTNQTYTVEGNVYFNVIAGLPDSDDGKPLVVVGHDLNGEYGHGVHSLNAHALIAAVDAAADSDYHKASYEQYGVWDTPKLYLHLYRENAITMNWDIPLERFEGATAYDMAVAGYACHISQHRWAFAVPKTGPSGHRFGLVRSLVGEDVIGGDMFENIEQPN